MASRIEQHYHDAGKIWLRANARASIVGTINFSNGSTRRIAHVGHFGIGLECEWRGVGLGSVLLSRLLQWAEAEPLIEKVALGVFSSNEWAMRLYRKFGFIEEGRSIARSSWHQAATWMTFRCISGSRKNDSREIPSV